jgi:hypothetical protein
LPQKIIKEAELDEEMESLKELSRKNSILPVNYLKESLEEVDTKPEDED